MFRVIRSSLALHGILSWQVIDAAENFVREASDEETAKRIARALNEREKLLTTEAASRECARPHRHVIDNTKRRTRNVDE